MAERKVDLALISPSRRLNRRSLLTNFGLTSFGLGLGGLGLAQIPFVLTGKNLTARLTIELPENYTQEQFENEVPLWADVDALRATIRRYVDKGQLTHLSKAFRNANTLNAAINGTSRPHFVYEFQFATAQDFFKFFTQVRAQGLVKLEERARLGLRAALSVNGLTIQC